VTPCRHHLAAGRRVPDDGLGPPSGQFGNARSRPGVHGGKVIVRLACNQPDLGRHAVPRACSKACASAINRGSLPAAPSSEMPTGRLLTFPAGTVIDGYPETAAGVDVPME